MSRLTVSGLKGPYADDYPARATALAIIEAMKTANGWTEVEKITGLDNAQRAADRCWLVYGYPELDPAAVSKWLAEGFMRASRIAGPAVAPRSELPTPDHSHGLGKR